MRNIFFNTASHELLPESDVELGKLLGLLKTSAAMRVEVGGHTDDVGADAADLKLSEQRANAVRDHLVAQGIDAARMRPRRSGSRADVARQHDRPGPGTEPPHGGEGAVMPPYRGTPIPGQWRYLCVMFQRNVSWIETGHARMTGALVLLLAGCSASTAQHPSSVTAVPPGASPGPDGSDQRTYLLLSASGSSRTPLSRFPADGRCCL